MGGEDEDEFTDFIFSWSLDDILNQHLYKSKVEKIPLTFDSEQHYFGSFVYPLLEETRAELALSMEVMYRYPSADIFSIHEARRDRKIVYDLKVGPWSNRFFERGKQPYRTLPVDLLILMDGKAESVSDLQCAGRSWAFSLVNKISENDNEDDFEATPSWFTVKASQRLEFQDGMVVVFLKNIKIQTRIWKSLRMNGNLSIIKEVLNPDFMVQESCSTCSFDFDSFYSENPNLFDKLNESQRTAVMASLHKTECSHNSYVEQIWGPPGTGKTTTVSILLFVLLQMNRRTLTCAPTNIALLQLASRVLSLVKESFKTTIASGNSFCAFGDMLLFGSKERLNVGEEMEEIYLEHRIEKLIECFGPWTGWKHCMRSMNDLLENCVSQYHVFLENELSKEKELTNENQNETETNNFQVKSFLNFVQDRFSYSVMPLRRCILTFLTHVPRSFMKEYNFCSMIYVLDNLSSFESLLSKENILSEELEHLFTSKPLPNELEDMSSINSVRAMSILVLRGLQISLEALGLPDVVKRHVIADFCFQRASLIFCTTSSSYKLHMVPMKPLHILVIDEAAQVKEAESTIPLQLPGMKHAILIGDECQLPAMVTSTVCIESGFGRSLFDRLSSLGHSRHLLNVQYRMSPSISFFPNWRFYQNQILDAESLLCESYEKRYLSGPMFGPYSFINVVGGIEEKDDDGRSKRNMVEVSLVIKIVQNLYRQKLEVPKSWLSYQEIIRFRYNNETDAEMSENSSDGRSYVENSKVSESLLLMKFYSLSDVVVKYLLSGNELDLPMQVSDEQMDIILFSKSSFIIGRSGTGKTTILTMKLFQNEQSFRIASEAIYETESGRIRDSKAVEGSEDRKLTVLRQLFVTVSPKLCHVVKQHVSHLTSISSNGSSTEINLDDDEVTSDFRNIPDTFTNIPVKDYPLVITFHKFLMMLDGTLGNSFFGRFLKEKEDFHHNLTRSVALQTFVRLREVTFDRFCSLYWPHFDSSLTKKLDPSRVFTEIVSHIKGGLQAGECSDGKLNYEGYSLLAKCRSSFLTKQKREIVYNLFQAYEKMKTERGEFDMGDFVNDLHRRLNSGHYEGDKMDFVYIDEVQDLSMRQISLFKYICHNVDEGFIFAGDTAQTIARGVDFRFQDIRSLFYKDFLTTKITGKQGKGVVSEIFQLKQNFRTHSGVLDLAQSVIDILYYYFVHSIDVLEPETSHICGESPVLLESGDDENAIATIFGGSGNGGEIVGFGAEQVILVRDDCAKIEICEYVGKHALVLTIVECKGLEFQDVLLYNFFGTSPLKDQWRVIYGYMKERDWIDEKLPQSFPRFSEARHSVMCSELKQLYVAITRTRQRLWLCENKEELSKPMFEYWKRRGLVQIRRLDDSVAQAMGVASSPQEWRERGKKLFYENNFAMATMCFEKAGDTMWEKLAKASGLRASADQLRGKKPEVYLGHLREAAAMFESIGKLESAASCYCDVGEYEIAGKIYLYKCEKIDAAAECFTLAGCYNEAAEAYAKGDQFSSCLSVCKKGKLFDKGMQYIEYLKENVDVKNKELEQVKQEFLESCALHYHKLKDLNFMNFVEAFSSVECKRVFLRSLGCINELLLLEEKWGQFLDAAELARSLGYVLKEADLLEKAGHFMEAADLLLWYIFFSSLWGNGNRGWPLKQFAMKEDLCEKARSVAKLTSDKFYDFVCNELKVLSDKHGSLPELKNDLLASQKNKNLRGEILSVRKILDSHFRINFSKYFWEDELPSDITKHCENNIFQSCVSVRTLVFYWNQWKENVMNIFQSIKCLENEETNKHDGFADFCISFFGVRKQRVNGDMAYLLVNRDADWIRNTGNKGLHREGKLVIMNIRELVFAIRSYWQSELLCVGIKVLEKLGGLHKSKSNGSVFHQSTAPLNLTSPYKKKLKNFIGISADYFDLVFPLDWRKSVSEDLVSLRKTDASLSFFDEIILQCVDINSDISYSTIGLMMMLWLGSRKPAALNDKIVAGLQCSPGWKSIVELWNVGYTGVCVAPLLRVALGDTFFGNRSKSGYISPQSFVHLLDRLLFMESFSSGLLFTTKTSFFGWFTELHPSDTALSALKQIYLEPEFTFFVKIIRRILHNKEETESWIRRSKINVSDYHPLLALKLVMMLSLICLQVSDSNQVLLDLLSGKENIEYLLPKGFVYNLSRDRKGRNLHLSPQIVSEAFSSIDNPLVIVSSKSENPQIDAPCAIFVDLTKSKEEILSILFAKNTTPCSQSPISNDGCEIAPDAVLDKSSDNRSGGGNSIHVNNKKAKRSSKGKKVKKDANIGQTSSNNERDGEQKTAWKVLEEMSEVITSNSLSSSSVGAIVKKEVDKSIDTFVSTFTGEDTTYVLSALNQLNLIASAITSDMGGTKAEQVVFSKCIQGLKRRLKTSSRGSSKGSSSSSKKVDGSSNHSVTIHEEAGSSSTIKTKESDEEKKETNDASVVLEKQKDSGNGQDAKNNKGKAKKCHKHRRCGCSNQTHPKFFR